MVWVDFGNLIVNHLVIFIQNVDFFLSLIIHVLLFLSFFYRVSIYHTNHPRERYGMWKTECQNMVPIVGSGKFITTPIITDDGEPIEVEGSVVTSADKKVTQWMLSLHQIGMYAV